VSEDGKGPSEAGKGPSEVGCGLSDDGNDPSEAGKGPSEAGTAPSEVGYGLSDDGNEPSDLHRSEREQRREFRHWNAPITENIAAYDDDIPSHVIQESIQLADTGATPLREVRLFWKSLFQSEGQFVEIEDNGQCGYIVLDAARQGTGWQTTAEQDISQLQTRPEAVSFDFVDDVSKFLSCTDMDRVLAHRGHRMHLLEYGKPYLRLLGSDIGRFVGTVCHSGHNHYDMAYPYSLDDSGDIHMRNEVRTVLNLLRLLEVKESPEDTSYLHGNLGPALEHLFPQPEAAEQHEANISKKISADIPATDLSIVGAKWLIPCDDNGTYHLGQGTFYWLVHHRVHGNDECEWQEPGDCEAILQDMRGQIIKVQKDLHRPPMSWYKVLKHVGDTFKVISCHENSGRRKNGAKEEEMAPRTLFQWHVKGYSSRYHLKSGEDTPSGTDLDEELAEYARENKKRRIERATRANETNSSPPPAGASLKRKAPPEDRKKPTEATHEPSGPSGLHSARCFVVDSGLEVEKVHNLGEDKARAPKEVEQADVCTNPVAKKEMIHYLFTISDVDKDGCASCPALVLNSCTGILTMMSSQLWWTTLLTMDLIKPSLTICTLG